MPDPTIAARQPVAVTLEAGKTYAWCRCGLSKAQPFCDGAHRGTGLGPLVFTAGESKEAWLCLCKQSGRSPYCDGTHAKLP